MLLMREIVALRFENMGITLSFGYFRTKYCSLTSEDGGPPDPKWFGLKYQNRDVLVTSTLGLCGGLLRQKELGDESYLASDSFKKIAEVINSYCAITGQPRGGANSQNTTLGNHARQAITNLKRELNSSQLLSNQDDDKATRTPRRKKQRLSKKSAGDILRTME